MSRERNEKMVALEERYPLGSLSLNNRDGELWQRRHADSESYFNDYSWDWRENQELLVDVRALEQKYGGYVMIARSIQQNFIASTYFRNPDPLIEDKSGDRDMSKMLSDMARSVLVDCGSERKMKEALEDRWWAGFGFVWASFLQTSDELPDGTLVPRKQRILLKRMSPWRVRYDPVGREWDMSDHAYSSVFFTPTLARLMTDTRFSDEDRRRVMASYKRGVAGDANFDWRSIRSTTVSDTVEDDPEYIRVPTWQIWARPEKKIYTQVAGTQFTMTPLDWPEEFAEEDCFPFIYMPTSREPEDKDSTRGFIGIPYIREIKPHLYAINRLESQFLAANQNAIFKYLSPKGCLSEEEQAKLGSDRQRQVIFYDDSALNAFPAQMRDKIKMEDILRLVPQPDLKELKHLEGIKHEMDMIAQIIGQAPGDRGGMPDSPTATDSIIVDRRLQTREAEHKHQAGGFFKQLIKLVFLILKHRQELPIPYQMTTPQFNQKVWTTFSADKLRNLDLHYDYAVGSGDDRTREEQFAMHERLASVVLPFLKESGNLRDQMKVIRDLVEVLNITGTEQYFQDDVQDLMAQLIAIQYGIQKGQINPADQAIAQKQVELISMLGSRLLTPDKMAQIVTKSVGAPEQGKNDEGMGSMAKPPSPGQQAYQAGAQGSAMAGIHGGTA